MIQLRHRTASGDLANQWEYDPARGVLEIVIRLGSAHPVALTVPVCHPDRPRLLAHPMMRLDGESWRILPAIFLPTVSVSRDRTRSGLTPHDCARAGGLRSAVPCELHEAIGSPAHLIITHSPPEQDAELEALGS